jgi:DNA-binding SARP family transcriptional activator
MARLSLSLLGLFQVALDGQPVTGFKSNKVRALLAYLAVETDRPHRRETLAGLLWPDWSNRDALGNLRYALSNLRHVLGDHTAEPPFLLITRDTIQFNPISDYWLDVKTLTKATQMEKDCPPDDAVLEEAVGLYQGNFLEGFSLEDSSAFEEWTLLTRERLARLYSSALRSLAEIHEKGGEHEQAQAYIHQQLEAEPWDEAAHQNLMRLLALNGQRGAALAQYETCRELLKKELGVEPDGKTRELYEQIRDGRLKMCVSPSTVIESSLIPAPPPPFITQEPPHTEPPVFVARESELSQLDRFLSQALNREGRVVFVTGEAGSGKTALIQEFTRQAQYAHADLIVAGGDCNAYTGIGDPYLPFREIMELLTGGVQARWSAGTITKEHACRLWNLIPYTVQALTDVGPDLIDTFIPRGALQERTAQYTSTQTAWMQRLDKLLEQKPAIGFGMIAQQQGNLFEQYTKALQTLAQQHPLLLVVDDLQWSDLGSISLLFHLGRQLSGSRILIVGAYRPEEVALEKEGKRHALEPVVNELRRTFGDILVNVDQAEERGFIDSFLDSEPNRLGISFREMLYQQTRGHPLFTIELLRGLQERGDLIQDTDGVWVEGPSLDWNTLPARVEAAIRERISRMPETLRKALAVACVEGELFTAEVVAHIRGIDEWEILDCLSSELDRRHRLIRAHSIQRLGQNSLSQYRFRHILFQKYLYSDLDEVERVHLHEQVGRILEELYSMHDQEPSIAVQLALHFQKAGNAEKALYYLHLAGTKAVQLSAYLESRMHLNRAMDLLMTLPESPQRAEQELELQLALGLAWMGDIPGPEWENAITRARELCQQTGKITELALSLGELAIYHYVRAEYQQAREIANETLQLGEHSGDALLIALGHWHLGFILMSFGEYVSAHEHLEQVIAFYDHQQHHQPFLLLRGSDAGVSAMAYDACCLWCLGYPDQAIKRSRESLTLARGFNHAFTMADVLCYGGCLFNLMVRDTQALKERAEELMRVSEGMGFLSFGGTGVCYLGCALAKMGQVQEGLAQISRGLEARQTIGALCQFSGILCTLTEAQAIKGNAEAGLATLTKVLAFVEERDERHWEPEIYRLRGELLVAFGDEVGAEVSFEKAIEVARHQQAKSWELRAATSLSYLWKKQGKQAEAHRLLSEIYNWFTEGFETPDLISAKRLLEQFVQ